MLKLYCYLLYKMYRFQNSSSIRRGIFRTISSTKSNAAMGMTMPFSGWLFCIEFGFMHLVANFGFSLKSGWVETLTVLPVLLIWASFVWINHQLIYSKRYKTYANEFAKYSSAKRITGSFFAFTTMLINFIVPIYLTPILFNK